jgi:hypothetical protein
MDWSSLSSIVRFSPMFQIFNDWKAPELKIEDRPLYYMGEGIFIDYTDKQFIIESLERVEYGEVGEYALNVAVYRSTTEISSSLNLRRLDFNFETSPLIIPFGNGISFGISHKETIKILIKSNLFYQEFETRRFNKELNTFYLARREIHCNDYILEYYGKVRNSAILGGIRLNLQ